MARLWYGGTPADFAIMLGADADIVDSAGVPTGAQGSATLVPLVAAAFDLYEGDLATPVTDLLDDGGNPITQITSETDFGARGTIPRFQGPDGYEHDLYATSDLVTFYRISPSTDTAYDRLGTLETSVTDLATTNLSDVSDTVATDGQVLVWDNILGEWVPETLAGVGALEQGEQVELTTGTDRLLLVRVHDDGTPTAGWVDRLAIQYEVGGQSSGVFDDTGWFNEFGEIRTSSSANSRVAMRAHGRGAGQTEDIFQVRVVRGDPTTDVLRVSPTAVTARQPLIVEAPYAVIDGTRLYISDTNPGAAPEGSVWIDTSDQEA